MKTGRNIEIKAKQNSPAAQNALARALADGAPETLNQVDTFFNALSGRLKLREFGDGNGELIAYLRPDTTEPTCSKYSIYRTSTPEDLKETLEQSLGVMGVVTKTRQLLMFEQTRIHLDEVEGLGHFVELEVVLRPDQPEDEGTVIARDLMQKLQIREEDLTASAYIDMLMHRLMTNPSS